MCWKREEPEPSPQMPAEVSTIAALNTTDGPACLSPTFPCNLTTCFHGGISCCNSNGDTFCSCPGGFNHPSCAAHDIEDPFKSVSGQANTIDGRVLGIVLVTVFLVAFVIVIAFIIRKCQKRRLLQSSHPTEVTILPPSNSDSANKGQERVPLQNHDINGCKESVG